MTSELAIPARGVWDYRSEGSLGAAFTVPGPGLVEIDDCVYGDTNYLVSEAGGVCESPGQTKLRTIGWVFSPALAQPPGTHAVYRCYLPGSDDHFVSIDPACEGAQTEFLVGYLY